MITPSQEKKAGWDQSSPARVRPSHSGVVSKSTGAKTCPSRMGRSSSAILSSFQAWLAGWSTSKSRSQPMRSARRQAKESSPLPGSRTGGSRRRPAGPRRSVSAPRRWPGSAAARSRGKRLRWRTGSQPTAARPAGGRTGRRAPTGAGRRSGGRHGRPRLQSRWRSPSLGPCQPRVPPR
jgi:hypothetical protein